MPDGSERDFSEPASWEEALGTAWSVGRERSIGVTAQPPTSSGDMLQPPQRLARWERLHHLLPGCLARGAGDNQSPDALTTRPGTESSRVTKIIAAFIGQSISARLRTRAFLPTPTHARRRHGWRSGIAPVEWRCSASPGERPRRAQPRAWRILRVSTVGGTGIETVNLPV